MFDKFQEIIQNSKTHRIVEVPEGHMFENTADPCMRLDPPSGYPSAMVRYQFRTLPKAKPAPAPVLQPRTISVHDRYPLGFAIPDGWEAWFADVKSLRAAGYTHVLAVPVTARADEYNALTTLNSVFTDSAHLIGLKKWNG